jgi:hypothetical protein
MIKHPIFSESRWKSVYTAIALMLVLIVMLQLAAACVSRQPVFDNTTANGTASVNSSTLITQVVQTPCSPSENATPYIIINPIGNHTVGDVFEINGTTNLGVNSKIKGYSTILTTNFS